MIADELQTQTNELVRCDMSLQDMLSQPDQEYAQNKQMIEAIDALADKIGDTSADMQTKDLAGKTRSLTSRTVTPHTGRCRVDRGVSISTHICGLQ